MTQGPTIDPLERIPTGDAGADEVLDGGFPAHSTNIIMGPPGIGKTGFIQQLLFANATPDRPVIYVSTLSEPLSKVLTYLQQFDFYDEDRMLSSLVYQDIGAEILERGVEYLLEHVNQLIREHRPWILVIDSFKAIHDLADSPVTMRRISAQVGTLLSAYEITTFLLGEYAPQDVSLYSEFAVVDGVVQLTRIGSDEREERFIRVLKLRGSGYREGLHAFAVSSAGVRVYPRLVTPEDPGPFDLVEERVSTGVPGLDRMLDGGIRRGTGTVVVGAAGTGKTTIGLEFVLNGVEAGEPSLFLNFQENPPQLSATIRRLGVDLDAQLERGLHLRYRSPVELKIDALVKELFQIVQEHGIRRVVIDALGDVELAATSGERFHDYIYSMTQHLAAAGVTTLFTLESRYADAHPAHGLQASRLSTLCDTLICLEMDHASEPQRSVRIVKSRGSNHSLEPQPLAITRTGMVVGDLRPPRALRSS